VPEVLSGFFISINLQKRKFVSFLFGTPLLPFFEVERGWWRGLFPTRTDPRPEVKYYLLHVISPGNQKTLLLHSVPGIPLVDSFINMADTAFGRR